MDIVVAQNAEIIQICVFLCIYLGSVMSKLRLLRLGGTKKVDESSALPIQTSTVIALAFMSEINCSDCTDDY